MSEHASEMSTPGRHRERQKVFRDAGPVGITIFVILASRRQSPADAGRRPVRRDVRDCRR
jgi:hypothetical protein